MFVTKRKLKVEIEMLQKKVQRLEHDRRRSARLAKMQKRRVLQLQILFVHL